MLMAPARYQASRCLQLVRREFIIMYILVLVVVVIRVWLRFGPCLFVLLGFVLPPHYRNLGACAPLWVVCTAVRCVAEI